jgi:chromosome segregation ATPase
LARIQAEIDALTEERSQAESVKRSLNDNIQYRKNRVKLEKLQAELRELDIAGAQRAKRRFDEEYEQSKEKQTTMSAKVSHPLA